MIRNVARPLLFAPLLVLPLVVLGLVACSNDGPQSAPTVQAQAEAQAQPQQTQQQQVAAQHDASSQAQAEPVQVQEDQDAAQQMAAQQAQQQEEAQAVVAVAEDPTFLPRDATETAEGIPIIRDSERPEYYGLDWSTEWGIRLIPFSELAQGAIRDAIPALSEPRYWTIEEAAEAYPDNSPLVHVNVNGDVRGFPLDILIFHEIVNDVIGGVPVAVTYCPLCNTAIAFESQIGDEVYRFGVSGLLRNSDLVMYDRNTESLWQQSSGRAIVGVMVGARLNYVPATVVNFGQLRNEFPEALVLSRDTGWNRSYGQNPYRGYDDPERGGPYGFFFDRDTIDERIPPAERVVSIEGPSGATIAYAWSGLAQDLVLQDSFDGIDLVVFWTPGTASALDNGFIEAGRDVGTTAVFETTLEGRALTFIPNWMDDAHQTFVDNETNSVWNIFGRAIEGELAGAQLTRVIHSDHFWFAWQAFHPDTELVVSARQAAADDES